MRESDLKIEVIELMKLLIDVEAGKLEAKYGDTKVWCHSGLWSGYEKTYAFIEFVMYDEGRLVFRKSEKDKEVYRSDHLIDGDLSSSLLPAVIDIDRLEMHFKDETTDYKITDLTLLKEKAISLLFPDIANTSNTEYKDMVAKLKEEIKGSFFLNISADLRLR